MLDKASQYRVGHRQRLKKKFLSDIGCSELEIIEIVLFFAIPRVDVKPLAHALYTKFGTLANICLVRDEQLSEVITNSSTLSTFRCLLKLSHELSVSILMNSMKRDISMNNWKDLEQFLRLKFGNLEYEQFSVIYLDSKARFLQMMEFGSGTIDESTIYIREVIKHGLLLGASGIVMAHNHPSGSIEPSKQDIVVTNAMSKAAKAVNIVLMDHVIVGRDSCFSFRNNFLLHS